MGGPECGGAPGAGGVWGGKCGPGTELKAVESSGMGPLGPWLGTTCPCSPASTEPGTPTAPGTSTEPGTSTGLGMLAELGTSTGLGVSTAPGSGWCPAEFEALGPVAPGISAAPPPAGAAGVIGIELLDAPDVLRLRPPCSGTWPEGGPPRSASSLPPSGSSRALRLSPLIAEALIRHGSPRQHPQTRTPGKRAIRREHTKPAWCSTTHPGRSDRIHALTRAPGGMEHRPWVEPWGQQPAQTLMARWGMAGWRDGRAF